MRDTIVLRMNEITLKKGNRSVFEQKLAQNVTDRLARVGRFTVRREQGNVVAIHAGPMDDAQVAAALEALGKVFGVARILIGVRMDKDVETIAAAAVALTAGKSGTFKVFARRSDKSFPMDSMKLAAFIGQRVLESGSALTVDVHDPQLAVTVEIGREAFVCADDAPGAGGLPAGVSGTVVALLSGGIDSPVAAWKLMRRGCKAVFVHFTGRPFVGRASEDKARRLAELLADWQGGATVWTVPIGEQQREIMLKAGEPYRVLLYRRLMLRVAERIAVKEGALALVTGDAVGQVASQTLENLAAVSAAATLPLYRPLIGEDKEDIVRVARRIGTYATSIEAHDDCCSLFMPQNPATRATAGSLDAEERKFDVDALVDAALAGATTERVTY